MKRVVAIGSALLSLSGCGNADPMQTPEAAACVAFVRTTQGAGASVRPLSALSSTSDAGVPAITLEYDVTRQGKAAENHTQNCAFARDGDAPAQAAARAAQEIAAGKRDAESCCLAGATDANDLLRSEPMDDAANPIGRAR